MHKQITEAGMIPSPKLMDQMKKRMEKPYDRLTSAGHRVIILPGEPITIPRSSD